MTGVLKMMISFGQEDLWSPQVRYDVVLQVSTHLLRATHKHNAELGVLFCRFVTNTAVSPDCAFTDCPGGTLLTHYWHVRTQCMERLVNGSVVELLLDMAYFTQPYLEHSMSDGSSKSDVYDAIIGSIMSLVGHLDMYPSINRSINWSELRPELLEALDSLHADMESDDEGSVASDGAGSISNSSDFSDPTGSDTAAEI